MIAISKILFVIFTNDNERLRSWKQSESEAPHDN